MSYVFTVPEDLASADPPEESPLDETEARRRYGRLLQASTHAARSLADLDRRFANDTDWATAPERFRADIDAVSRAIADSFDGDRTGRALFLRDYSRLAEAKTGAFKRLNAEREDQAIAAAYADRMATLAEIARTSNGPQRDEAIRQAKLEAHRAHAFGLVDAPVTEAERFVVEAAQQQDVTRSGSLASWSTASDRNAAESMSSNQTANQFGVEFDRTIDRDAYERALNVRGADDAPTLEEVIKSLDEAKGVLAKSPNDVEARLKYDQAVSQLESRDTAISLALTIMSPFLTPAGAGALSFAIRSIFKGIIRSEIEAMKVIPIEQQDKNSLQVPDRLWEMGESP